MSVKIRLKRLGKIRVPQYRIVVVDSRKKRDGKVIEEIGTYQPKQEPSHIDVVSERAQYWLGVGAQPSEAVAAILKVTGDWQKFKGEPGAEGTLKQPAPARDKLAIFNEALKEASSEPRGEAVTGKAEKPGKGDEKGSTKKDQPAGTPDPEPTPRAESPEGAVDAAEAGGTPADDKAADKPAENPAEGGES